MVSEIKHWVRQRAEHHLCFLVGDAPRGERSVDYVHGVIDSMMDDIGYEWQEDGMAVPKIKANMVWYDYETAHFEYDEEWEILITMWGRVRCTPKEAWQLINSEDPKEYFEYLKGRK